MKRILLSIGLMAAATSGYAQPGTLDVNFGTGGKVEGVLGQYIASRAYAVTTQPDGKILVAGQFDQFGPPAPYTDFLVARYNTDGTLDNSFDGDGWATTDFNSGSDVARAILVQPDGKIVVGGVSTVSSQKYFAVAKYNTDGSLDLSFNGTGKNSNIEIGQCNSMALQADGQILVAGTNEDNSVGIVVRLKTNGNLDASFGSSGRVNMSLSLNPIVQCVIKGVTVQPDGKILAAGYSLFSLASSDQNYGIARLKTDGSLDNTFANGGVLKGNSISNDDIFNAIALQPDGKILAAGLAVAGNAGDVVVTRLNADGSPDNGFGTAGMARTFSLVNYVEVKSIALQNDGRIVVAGGLGAGAPTYLLMRFNPNGTIDNSFDGDGQVTTSITGNDIIYGMAIQSDGKIVAVGNSGSLPNFTLLRYLGGDGVNVNEVANSASPKVYPNPGNGVFVMEALKAGVVYTVTDAKGSIVSAGTTTKGQTKIDLTKNANGIYLLQIENETVKLVKQ